MTLHTEQTIVEAAILVFNEDYSAPLEKVAEQAGVTRRTLHRYFTGREALLIRCEQEMQRSCRRAMLQALSGTDDARTQLEAFVRASVRCGGKYSLFHKLHTRFGHQHSPEQADCAAFDALAVRLRELVLRLQQEGAISAFLTAEWVLQFFNATIAATNQAAIAGDVAPAQLEQFAWFSFSKGIGL